MDEIQQRLTDTTAACIQAYQTWREKMLDSGKREALQEAIHELRKVSSRLEIEIALSERDQMAERPLPIPAHRSNRKNRNQQNNNGQEANGNLNPRAQEDNAANADTVKMPPVKKVVRRARPPKAEGSGE